MLKKAKSFREKFRRGALNRASASTSALRATLARSLSITGKDRKRGDAGTPDKQAENGEVAGGGTRPTKLCPDEKSLSLLNAESVHPNVRKVQNEKRKVTQALKYINFAIDKSNMILLPGSATVALEEIFGLITLITGLMSNEDPSAELTYYLQQTYNALAELIEWADTVMLMDIKTQLDVNNAKRVIRGIETSVDDLTEFTCEVAKHIKVQITPTNNYTMTLPSKSRQRRAAAQTAEDRAKRNSMPEVPLTPREKTILRETSLGAFDNPLALERVEPISPTSPSQLAQAIDEDLEAPPPKPYLPPEFSLRKTLSRSSSMETPPELPVKQSKQRPLLARGQALAYSSSIDSLDNNSDINSRPKSAVLSGHYLTRFDTSSNRSGGSSLCASRDSIDGPIISAAGKRASMISNSSQSSAGCGSQSMRYNVVMGPDGKTYLQAPLAQSEDLSPIQPILRPAGAATGTGYMGAPVDLNDLTSRIDQLTMGFISNSATGQKGTAPNLSHPPSTSERKHRSRIGSDYDNVSNGSSYDSNTNSPAVTPMMAASDSWTPSGDRNLMNRSFAGLPSVNQWHQQQMSGQAYLNSMAAAGTLRHASSLTVHTTTNSSESLRVITESSHGPASRPPSSASVPVVMRDNHRLSGISGQFQPPPLPPKRKHVESYMHVFGTETQLSEFNPVDSFTSRQFYLHMQEQHQRELFQHHAMLMHNGGAGGYMYHPQHQCPEHRHAMMLHDGMEGTEGAAAKNLTEVSEGDESYGPSSQRSSLALSDTEPEDPEYAELNPLDMVDVRELLIRESEGSSTSSDSAVGSISSNTTTSSSTAKPTNHHHRKGGSSKIMSGLKGGSVDALVVYATHVGKHDFMYQEAFLTTYRTFITPEDLIDKLLYRYNKFAHSKDVSKKRLSRNAFSLLVRVLDELTSSELKEAISLRLLKLVTELVREGELTLAKIMRRKVLEKCDPNQRPVQELQIVAPSSGPKSPSRVLTLVDFKSHEIAEHLTLIETDFYQRLELPELLTWSREQNEEKCPNLVQFTEHFNKMSWWCRNVILKPDDQAIREKYFIKFVHILKHLRKHNNFNSLLALLSALDSAPVSRLDWPRQEKDMISEYFHLIDCTSSFKSYRTALSEAEPPFIPYIGLILNDMTIIRVGNTSNLADGNINFQMRWHLFNVLECLRRFRKPVYPFKKDPKILQFLDNFSDHNSSDDEMWERSKEIKPSGNR